ncbi:hypothetical protein P5P86_19615 [Nocardioides sp. BP30]|uniref:hypothetical protein n=1 Tax=Nocardioides sp. BP30 TaxID=3036374 RepID=UPI0024684C29|nr:hypothetical protein [Nocardioides sp. BP30]WGL52147.1 hypothetical protein P5P86_19615 [Nocardioides sp. BP30]
MRMPYSESTRPYADMSDRDRVKALFAYPWFRAIRHPAFAHTVDTTAPGRPAEYPPLLQFMLVCLARAYGSQNAALRALNRDGLWQVACDRYRTLVRQDVDLPAAPPTPAQMDGYIHRHFGTAALVCMPKPEQARRDDNAERTVACKPGWEVRTVWSPNDESLSLLRSEFMVAALSQASKQGMLPTDFGDVDFANPDPRFVFFGDGTWLKPFSEATLVLLPGGEKHVSKSRAQRGRHRLPDLCRTGKVDEKEVLGICNIFIGMWTSAGRIVVMADQTIGSETPKAMAMLRSLIAALQDRVHVIVWDRALSGSELHEVMATHRTMILTKPIARSRNSIYSDGETALDLSEEAALTLHKDSKCLPLGTSIHTKDGKKKRVRSKFHRFTQVPDEIRKCRRLHDLWVDGNALWDVYEDPTDGHRYKSTVTRCIRAVPQPAATLHNEEFGIVWEVPHEMQLPCQEAPGGVHEFVALHRPVDLMRGRPASGPQKSMYDLRPIGTADERFWTTYNLRNNAESLNSAYKRTFGNKDHAMRLRGHEQMVDQIAFSFLTNAMTWHNDRRQKRDARSVAPVGATSLLKS